MPRLVTIALAALLVLSSLSPSAGFAAEPADWDIANGHFYTQASGEAGSGKGFAITDDDGILFWREFKRLGGVSVLGYPATQRFVWDGFVVQATQRVVMQWRPEVGRVYFANVFDRLHDLGKDTWLESVRQTPPPFDTSPDSGLGWDQVTARHWAFLDQNAAIKQTYWADSDPLQHYGLPMSYGDYSNVFVIRAQRATFQYWKEDVPWARKGTVTVALGGDIAKEAGVFPAGAITPGQPPASGQSAPVVSPQPTVAPTPVSTWPYRFTGLSWEPNCGLTAVKVFVRDSAGNAVDGVRLHIDSGGGWNVDSNPTGSTGYQPGWTDFILRSEPVAHTWSLWVIDGSGNRVSDVIPVTTDTQTCTPGGSGHQVATVTLTKER